MSAKSYGPAYAVLLVLSGLFAIGAVITLVPSGLAPWPNILGYKSVCPFAPGATFACALLAAITCTIRARLVKRVPSPVFVPATAIVLLVAALAWSTLAWAGEKAKYIDSTSSASTRQ
jgi:hypothetical protein